MLWHPIEWSLWHFPVQSSNKGFQKHASHEQLLAYTHIFRESQIDISKQSANDILSIAETTRLHYVANRNKKMDQDILSKIGINLQSF